MSFVYAWKGLRQAFREERNLKIHFSVAVIVIAAGLYFRITRVEWFVVLISIGLVIGFELMNTALENLADLITKERNPLVGKIKDIAAAAVLVVSIASAVIGLIVFLPYLRP